jgi:hypothetical protein
MVRNDSNFRRVKYKKVNQSVTAMYEIKVTDTENQSEREPEGFDKYDIDKHPKKVLVQTQVDIEYEKPLFSPIKRKRKIAPLLPVLLRSSSELKNQLNDETIDQ